MGSGRLIDDRTVAAVLFDVDGVPTDTAGAHGRVRRREDNLRSSAPERDPDEEHRSLDRLMAAGKPGFRAFDGVAGPPRALPPGRWAVVTSSRAEPTAARLARTGPVVPEVRVRAEDVSEGGPSPEGCLIAAARPGADPARCLVVEDAPAGMAAGLAAGCTVYAVASTHRPDELRDAHACFGSAAEAAGAILHCTEDAQHTPPTHRDGDTS
ncbi:HAD-IA family hydrolase [Streptomyces sp. NPDC002787]